MIQKYPGYDTGTGADVIRYKGFTGIKVQEKVQKYPDFDTGTGADVIRYKGVTGI